MACRPTVKRLVSVSRSFGPYPVFRIERGIRLTRSGESDPLTVATGKPRQSCLGSRGVSAPLSKRSATRAPPNRPGCQLSGAGVPDPGQICVIGRGRSRSSFLSC